MSKFRRYEVRWRQAKVSAVNSPIGGSAPTSLPLESIVTKIVIAEDDQTVAALLEEVLADAGYDVCGSASTVAGAVELCRRCQPDLAVIDVRLADGCGMDVAAAIGRRDTLGILYATGNAGYVLLNASDGEACITKPYSAPDLLRALDVVFEIKKSGTVNRRANLTP